MKTLNKSELFKKAWRICKFDGVSFSEALKTAWKEAKTRSALSKLIEAQSRIMEANKTRKPSWHVENRVESKPAPYYAGAESYYQAGRSYYGD